MNEKLPVKIERETPLCSYDVGVEVVVRFGKKRHPLTVDAARALRDSLNEALRPRAQS